MSVDIASQFASLVISYREALHRIPELAWQETQTINYITCILHSLSLNFTVLEGGVICDIVVAPGRSFRLLRADMDGLPITEDTGLEFASEIEGQMHACGHDCHAAMLLALANLITQGQVEPEVNLRLVWQRAEENPIKASGGQTLVQEGVLDNVAEAYALHVWPMAPVGTLLSRVGCLLVNSDRFRLKFLGTGGHVAQYGMITSPVDAMVDFNLAYRLLAEEYGSDKVLMCQGGVETSSNTGNIIPKWAEAWFAARNLFQPEDREIFCRRIMSLAEEIGAQYSGCEFEYAYGHPALYTNEGAVNFARQVVLDVGFDWQEAEMVWGGEDFAYYLQKVPGAMIFLGAQQEGSGPIHSPTFNPDSAALVHGLAFWIELTQRPLLAK